jgi:hypothetical protein
MNHTWLFPKRFPDYALGHVLPLAVVDRLIEEHRAELEESQAQREMPKVDPARVLGRTSAERYVSAAVQAEAAWLAQQVEGTGERHKGLLISSMKLTSLRVSEWLPPDVRATIDPYAALLPGAVANGYVSKYGEDTARRTIADGIAYARPRSQPEFWDSPRPQLRWSGGQWVREVTV